MNGDSSEEWMMLKWNTVLMLAAVSALSGSQAFAFGQKLAAGTASLPSTATISDSLVKDLKCSELTPDNVLSSLQPNAFSVDKQIPVRNWSSGLLGQCWSLSHSQRILFYLGRFGASIDDSRKSERNEAVLNMIRGTVPQKKQPGRSGSEYHAPLFVFPIEDAALSGSSLLYTLVNGISTANGDRDFQHDIEHYQQNRFGVPSNVKMLAGDRERSQDTNAQTWAGIQADLSKNRIPMIVLRPARSAQHVVLVKRVTPNGDGTYAMDLYDSNYPGSENHMTYSETDREFYAPNVIRYFGVDPNGPVGVFLVDDDDMDTIQNKVYSYYAERCQKAGAVK